MASEFWSTVSTVYSKESSMAKENPGHLQKPQFSSRKLDGTGRLAIARHIQAWIDPDGISSVYHQPPPNGQCRGIRKWCTWLAECWCAGALAAVGRSVGSSGNIGPSNTVTFMALIVSDYINQNPSNPRTCSLQMGGSKAGIQSLWILLSWLISGNECQ